MKVHIYTLTMEVPKDFPTGAKGKAKMEHHLSVLEDSLMKCGYELYDSSVEKEEV